MPNYKLYKGYDPSFLEDGQNVDLPVLTSQQNADLAKDNNNNTIISYINYCVALSASRKFPYFTASNIDGSLFKKISRDDVFDGKGEKWLKDTRIGKDMQWGNELYNAQKSDFDKGHQSKREDVQWGTTNAVAKEAAKSTFYYPNAVPQHKNLNRKIWGNLEDYILHEESIEHRLKVIVFTGPVLADDDPVFITRVNDQDVKLPVLFWKVVYYIDKAKKLSKAGFLMGQKSLLASNGITKPVAFMYKPPILFKGVDVFMDFDEAETYQVNVSLIENLGHLKFQKAKEPYTDTRLTKLVLEEIDIRYAIRPTFNETTEDKSDEKPGISIKNIKL